MFRSKTVLLAAAGGAFTPKALEHYTDRLNPGVGRAHSLLLDEGRGSYLFDASGRKYLDFSCGIGVTNLGHCHERLVKVVQKQATKLWHGQVCHGIHTSMAELMEEMSTILPPQLDNLMFSSTGAEAVETALKIARSATGRQNVVVLQGGFHGRTNACLAMTTSKCVYANSVRPLMPGVLMVPIPYTTQLKVDPKSNVEEMTQRCVGMLDDILHQGTHPSEVAMLLVEPVLGEGGYLPLPVGYLKALRQICDKHGILLVFDEVQSGFGRTGTTFTFEQTGVLPDILVYAKGMANGLPLAGVATTKALASKCPVGTHGGTYAGNALATASAAEVIRIMKDENILQNVADRSVQLFDRLRKMAEQPSVPIAEVRGRGLMIGIQFDASVPAGFASAVVAEACNRQLLLLSTSKFEVLRLIPPLNVSEEQVRDASSILEDSIKAVAASKKVPASSTKPALSPCCATPCYNGGAAQPCRWVQ